MNSAHEISLSTESNLISSIVLINFDSANKLNKDPVNLTLDLPLAADDVVKRALAGNEAGQGDRGQEDEEEGTHGDQADVVSSGNLPQLWDFLLMPF